MRYEVLPILARPGHSAIVVRQKRLLLWIVWYNVMVADVTVQNVPMEPATR